MMHQCNQLIDKLMCHCVNAPMHQCIDMSNKCTGTSSKPIH